MANQGSHFKRFLACWNKGDGSIVCTVDAFDNLPNSMLQEDVYHTSSLVHVL